MTTREGRRGGQRGFAATELVVGVGVLLLPVALVVLTIPTWSERQTTARVVAREIARAVVALGTCDVAHARATGSAIARNLGLPSEDVRMELDCPSGAVLDPGGEVEAVVTVRMPAVHLAAVGDVGAWSWTAHHRQPVDVYVGAP